MNLELLRIAQKSYATLMNMRMKMRVRFSKKRVLLLAVSIISCLAMLYLFIFQPPQQTINIYTVAIPVLLFFFISFFTWTTTLVWYITKNLRRGVLFGGCLITLLLLRYFQFTNPLYILLTILIFITLELTFKEK